MDATMSAEPLTPDDATLDAARAALAELVRERDEARRHARDHHIEGGCLTCMAMESEWGEILGKLIAAQRAAPDALALASNPLAAAATGVIQRAEKIGTYAAFDPYSVGPPVGFWRDVDALRDAVDALRRERAK